MGAVEALQEVLASPGGAAFAAGMVKGAGSALGGVVAKTTSPPA